MHRVHPTTGLTYAMRMKTLQARPVASLSACVAALMTSLGSRILLYVNVRTSFQTIA
jgi:hypothetical protein